MLINKNGVSQEFLRAKYVKKKTIGDVLLKPESFIHTFGEAS